MRRKLSLLLPFVGLVLFAYIVMRTGPDRIAAAFSAANAKLLALSPVFVAVVVVLRGARWRMLMKVVGIEYSLWRCVTVWVIGFFAAAVTPAKAGDVIRAVYLQNEVDRPFGEAFLTVFMDRLLDLVLILLLGVVSVPVFSHYYTQLPSYWLVLVAAVGAAVVVYLASKRTLVRRLLKPVFDLLVPGRYKDRFSLNFRAFYDSLGRYRHRPGTVAAAALLTVAAWAVIFSMAWYLTVVFGIDIHPAYMFLIMPVVTVVEMIPVSVSGLGTRDATVIYFFSVVAVSGATAVSFSLGYLLVGTYLTAGVGFVLWLRNPVALGAS